MCSPTGHSEEQQECKQSSFPQFSTTAKAATKHFPSAAFVQPGLVSPWITFDYITMMMMQAPPLFKGLSGAIRGYGRDISPAAALDLVAGGGNIVIVDIRSDREKENGGVPDLPSGNRSDLL